MDSVGGQADVPPEPSDGASLFAPAGERHLRSVTANTRRDGEQFLRLAERFEIRATTTAYPMAAAPRALSDLAHGRFGGAAVLFNQA